jgi:hypothetical protein
MEMYQSVGFVTIDAIPDNILSQATCYTVRSIAMKDSYLRHSDIEKEVLTYVHFSSSS